MDAKNREEITEVLSNIENLRAAQVIYQNYSATFNHIIEKHFNPKMEVFSRKRGLEYHFEKSEESYIRFYFKKSNWEDKCWIGFTFEANRFYYGICNNPNIFRISDQNRKILHEKLNEKGINPCKQNDWWPFYAYLPNLSLETWESDIINSDYFLNDCQEKIEKLSSTLDEMSILL